MLNETTDHRISTLPRRTTIHIAHLTVKSDSIDVEVPKALLRQVLNSVEGRPFLYRQETNTTIIFMNHDDHVEIWTRCAHEFSPFGIVLKEQLRVVSHMRAHFLAPHLDRVKFAVPQAPVTA